MNDKKYEKKIAELEDDLQFATNQIDVLRSDKELLRTQLLSEQENFHRSLIVWLSDVYQKLANVQTGILENLNKLNLETAKTQKKKVTASIRALKEALEKTNAIGYEPEIIAENNNDSF